MTLHQVLIITLISVLVFMVWYRGRRIKKLETQRPTLDLWNFERIYNFGVLLYGDEDGEAIANTCIRTAEDMRAKVTVHRELHEQIKEEEKRILNDTDPLANERLEKLRRLHHLLL